MSDATKRRLDAVVVWKLDRFGRSLRHLITTIEELQAAGVAFISMGEGIDTTSPTGRLMLGIVGSFAAFERERLIERVHLGLARARAQGVPLGRRRQRIREGDLARVAGMSVREAARALGVPPSRLYNERKRVFINPPGAARQEAPENALVEATV